MNIPPFDKQRRLALLQERERLMADYIAARHLQGSTDNSADAKAPQQAAAPTSAEIASRLKINRQQYDDVIPRMKISECPFTGKPLVVAFDPVSLDGLWWMEFTRRVYSREHRPETFRLLRGAVNLCGPAPQGGRHDALLGPEVPYVIPRILDLPSMVLVISQIQLESGHIAYPLAYFASQSPGPGQLTSPWLEKNQYYFRDAAGRERWSIANDPWDFDIRRWIVQGRVRWIMPEQNTLAPASVDPANCPYCDLPGRRLPQLVQGDEVFTEPLPNPKMTPDFSD